MKKVLVTGGVGFVGSNLIQSLISRGYEVYSIDDYSSGSLKNELAEVKYIKMNILNISDLNLSLSSATLSVFIIYSPLFC